MLRMPELKKDPSRNMVCYHFTMRGMKPPRKTLCRWIGGVDGKKEHLQLAAADIEFGSLSLYSACFAACPGVLCA
jgi:hypothetical protein